MRTVWRLREQVTKAQGSVWEEVRSVVGCTAEQAPLAEAELDVEVKSMAGDLACTEAWVEHRT